MSECGEHNSTYDYLHYDIPAPKATAQDIEEVNKSRDELFNEHIRATYKGKSDD